jgi:uncharacterized membrane protein
LSNTSNKVVDFAIAIAVIGVVATMTILGTAGSITVWNILDSIQTWAPLIGLGVGLSLYYYFKARKR